MLLYLKFLDGYEACLYDGYEKYNYTFNFNGLYRVFDGLQDYYFRFNWKDCSPVSVLYFVNWADGKKPPAGNYQIFHLTPPEVSAPVEKSSIAMIGDSITWYGSGGHYRFYLQRLLPDFYFVGNFTDSYGFFHDGYRGAGTAATLDRIDDIPVADNYVVLIGTNDRGSIEETISNIFQIVAELSIKNLNAIVYLSTLLPRTYFPEIDDRNRIISEELRTLFQNWDNVRLVDFDREFRNLDDWPSLLADGLHPNNDGYREMSKIVSSAILENNF